MIPAQGTSHSLQPAAEVALDAGRMLMEAGANARSVERIVEVIARGLGAERIDLRIGYASLSITIASASSSSSCMRRVGPLGVNQQLNQRLWELAQTVSRGGHTPDRVSDALLRLAKETRHHSPWFTALAVGLACAAFGRLLGIDWPGAAAVFVASTAGQYIRKMLLVRHMNPFICTALISFLSCLVGGVGAYRAGSQTIPTAMVAAILLLVPGVPAVNAQSDILDGHPTLGSARAVSVAMTLVFMAAGLWVGRAVFNYWH